MKKLILLMFIALSGCTTSAHFDNNEYATAVQLEVQARHTALLCTNPSAVKSAIDQLNIQVDYFVTYTKYLEDNENTYKITREIQLQVEELKKKYENETPTTAYCELKFKIIILELQRTLEAITKKVK